MTNELRERVARMKAQTFGVEVEMNNITRQRAAEIVAEYWHTTAYDSASEYGYYSWACKDPEGRVWKFQKDVSIVGDDDQKCEMVTPILTYDADMVHLQEIVRLLRHAGAKSSPSRGCGVHVHIGADGHTPQTLRHLVNIMASHESALIEALQIDTDRVYRYCQPVDQRFLNQLNRTRPRTMSSLADCWYRSQGYDYNRFAHYNQSRYHILYAEYNNYAEKLL